jgi:RHS repeat-associated protein
MTNGLDGKVMTYDLENRPLSVTFAGKKTCYVYGADGTRRKKIENFSPTQSCDAPTASQPVTLYLGNVEIRKWGQGNAEEILLYPVPSIRIALTKDAGGAVVTKVSTLHRDALGSVRAVTNAAGLKAERSLFRPFGEEASTRFDLATAVETKGFIGQRFDADAGLQYLNARYYDPKLAIFIQPDWWEVTKAGVGTSRYVYSANDPVNRGDPGGHSWLDRAWDSIFGGGSFNRTFGDRGSAWSDRTFGNVREREVGRQFKGDVGTKTDKQLISNGQKWWGNYSDYKAARIFAGSGTAAQGDSFVADAALLGTGAGFVYKAGKWVYTGAKASMNGARVFWTGQNAAQVSAKAAAQRYAQRNGATTLEMTLTGKAMDVLYNTNWLGTEKRLVDFSDDAWNWASARFANGATSATVVMGTSVREGSTWATIEAPTLLRNGIEWAVEIWR